MPARPDSRFTRNFSSLVNVLKNKKPANTSCVILFHDAHNVVFFAPLVERKNLTYPSLSLGEQQTARPGGPTSGEMSIGQNDGGTGC